MDQEKVIVIDFGGQYNQLVARRVRECNVYCEIYSYKTDLAQIKAMNPKGIILTGGPNSCYEDGAPTCTKELFELGVPVLGLCYGAQLMQHVLGGKVEKAPVREYGKTETFVDKSSALFSDVSEKTIVWMSHFDYISQVAPGFKIVAHTADCPVAAAECTEKNLYAIQFHPEVLHTQEGTKMLHNFVRGVCGCAGTWKMDAFVENTIKEIREKVGSGKVLLALSGGVDSSVAAGLLSRAIGKQLTCVFVDHGLLRKDEGDEVENVFLSVLCFIYGTHGLCLDGNATLSLQVHIVQDLCLHLSAGEQTGLLNDTVRQGGFAVIYVCHNTKIADFALIYYCHTTVLS